MKKGFFAVLMIFLSFSAFAQNWSIGGELYADYYKWNNSLTSGGSNEFYVGISIARYFSERTSFGINGAVAFLDKGSILSAGIFFQYDFLKYQWFSFGLAGSFLYSRFNDSYAWNDDYNAIDADRISVNGAARFAITPNRNVELYMNILELSFRHDWLILPDYNLKCTTDQFVISYPLNTVSLGIKFKI
ncbi:MAG: hypothetical protein LBC88_01640 [Spirochaetaceae bacterium]|jgi:hypothetical protein|nr:hypothetical protein [Spirochaetaceae bacterium]